MPATSIDLEAMVEFLQKAELHGLCVFEPQEHKKTLEDPPFTSTECLNSYGGGTRTICCNKAELVVVTYVISFENLIVPKEDLVAFLQEAIKHCRRKIGENSFVSENLCYEFEMFSYHDDGRKERLKSNERVYLLDSRKTLLIRDCWYHSEILDLAATFK